MASMHDETMVRLGELRIGAIIRTNDEALAADAMRAVVAGGIRMVEFTLNTPGALRSIETFAADSQLMVGAGTVMTAEQARDAVSAGARFIVSPNLDSEVIAESRRLGVVSIPGTYTPSEMVNAVKMGADIVKLFPAPADIAQYVRQIVGPLPELRIFPTAGVSPENFLDVLQAGAFGCGFVSSLFKPQDMQARNFPAIEKRAADIVRRLATMSA